MSHVFTDPRFWQALEQSGSMNHTRGMQLHRLQAGDATLFTFSKTHSYGEYIFDWAWAQAYEKAGMDYYPKLTSMVPFTPATTPHFWGPTQHWEELLKQHQALLPQHSSAHFLFTTEEEQRFLGERGYLLRDSFQYHFFNEGDADFEHWLQRLKAKKAKHIRQERVFPTLKIEALTGASLTEDHAHEMHELYLLTMQEKQSIPYLAADFFKLTFKLMPEHVLYVRAIEAERTIAGSLFFYDKNCLYGRYWGAKSFIPNLHFELCYYQGIDFCLTQKLARFEAGAQGEHKIARGFRPTLTRSAHDIRHPGFREAIANFIQQEKKGVQETIHELTSLLPFLSTYT